MNNPQLNVEVVPLASLVPLEKNAKVHTPEQLDQLRASIRQFGFRDPIGVCGNVIVEGHGRWQAAQAEGLTEVPIVRLDHLTERERDAYAIAHNQTQLSSGMNLQNLESEIVRLGVTQEEYMQLGLSDSDVHFLFQDSAGMPGQTTDGARDVGGEEAGTRVSSPHETSEWNDMIRPIVQSVLTFSDQDKYRRFMAGLAGLSVRYLDEPGVPSRLLRLMREQAPLTT